MLLKIDLFYIPTPVSLAVVATIITVSILLSLRATRGQGRRGLPVPAQPPFRVATEAEDGVLEPVWSRGRETAARDRGAPRDDSEPVHRHEGDLR